MYRIIVTCHYPDWPQGVKTWLESLTCVAGPVKKLSRAENHLRRRGFEKGGHYPYSWTVHPNGDEAYYEAKIVRSDALGAVSVGKLPDHVCAGDDPF